MTPDEFAQLQDDFLALRELADTEREQRLSDLAATRPAAAKQLRQLLVAEVESASLLEKPLASLVSAEKQAMGGPRKPASAAMQTTQKFVAVSENPDVPDSVGPYRILQQIGEGGHGMVFMAEQREPIRRKVALKLIKPGMESKMILARFEAERQALAMMEHPSIANVIDAGSSVNGSPYFVMELVHGTPIDQFCRENRLSLTETLKLFQQVCHAVHHANRKGIIHRDIKPANVLVTVDSGRPLPKVIDFGIAKAMHLTLTERTMFTEYGQIIGTLEYMSPEQALMSQCEADVRMDVYSLGVLLYVLLTGSPPISKQQLLQNGLFELRTALNDIRPPTPSLRLTDGQQARTWREQNANERRHWLHRLKGDLDWITMKALEKNPDERYDSVAAFSADLQRFLSSEEVQARPPSLTYKLSRWTGRHRTAATLLGGLLACVVISFAAVTWGYLKSQQNLAESEEQRERADANARKLANRLNREILETAWRFARDGDSRAATEQLGQIAEKDRDYTWQLVNEVRKQEASPPLRSERDGPIRQMVVHSATGQLAVITTGSRLELRRLADGSKLTETMLEPALYNCLEFNDDGTELLIGAQDWLQVFSVSNQSVSGKIQHRRGGTRAAAFDRGSGAWVVTTGANYIVKIDAAPLAQVHVEKLPARLGRVEVLPPAGCVVVSALDGTAFVLSASDLRLRTTISGADTQLIDFRQFDDRLHAVSYSGAHFRAPLLPESPSAQFDQLPPHANDGDITDATILDENSILLSTRDGAVNVKQREGSNVLVRQYSSAITDHALTSGALIVRHFDGRISRLASEEIRRAQNTSPITDMTDGLSLSVSGTSVTTHLDGAMRLWDSATGQQLVSRDAHSAEVFSIDTDIENSILASFGSDWNIRLSDPKTLKEQNCLPASGGVRPVCVSHSGDLLAAAPDRAKSQDLREGTIDLWMTDTGKSIRRLIGHENWVIQLQFSSDDERLVSLGVDGTIRVWNVNSGEPTRKFDFSTESPVNNFALCEEKGLILCGHHDGSLSLWDIERGEVIARRQLLSDQIGNVAIPTGSMTAVIRAANSPNIVLVEVDRLSPIASFDAGIGDIKGLRVGKRGHYIQIVGKSGSTRKYRLPK